MLTDVYSSVKHILEGNQTKLNARYIATVWKRAYRKQLSSRPTPYSLNGDLRSRPETRRNKPRFFCLNSVTDPPAQDKSSASDLLDLSARRETKDRLEAWQATLSNSDKELLRCLTGEQTSVELDQRLNVHPKTIRRRLDAFRRRAARDLQEFAP